MKTARLRRRAAGRNELGSSAGRRQPVMRRRWRHGSVFSQRQTPANARPNVPATYEPLPRAIKLTAMSRPSDLFKFILLGRLRDGVSAVEPLAPVGLPSLRTSTPTDYFKTAFLSRAKRECLSPFENRSRKCLTPHYFRVKVRVLGSLDRGSDCVSGYRKRLVFPRNGAGLTALQTPPILLRR